MKKKTRKFIGTRGYINAAVFNSRFIGFAYACKVIISKASLSFTGRDHRFFSSFAQGFVHLELSQLLKLEFHDIKTDYEEFICYFWHFRSLVHIREGQFETKLGKWFFSPPFPNAVNVKHLSNIRIFKSDLMDFSLKLKEMSCQLISRNPKKEEKCCPSNE